MRTLYQVDLFLHISHIHPFICGLSTFQVPTLKKMHIFKRHYLTINVFND